MTDTIAAGNIFIEESGRLPDALLLQREPHSSGWAAVQNARSTFDNEVPKAGWTFFFMAGEMKATVFGFDKQKTLRTALKRLIRDVKSQGCNSVEITQVAGHRFLTLPYVSVFAHPRHLQKGSVFSGQKQ
jgi:hypothetical protein